MLLLTPSRISALITEHGIKPRKVLGQNFLADANVVRRIVRTAGVQPGDHILEIGPGLGSLTLGLLEAGAKVTAVERDRTLADVCRSVAPDAWVVTGNALGISLESLVEGDERVACVSNLPYSVATALVLTVLEHAPTVARLVVMVQSEVAERLCAGPGHPGRGASSVKVEWHGVARVAFAVSPTVFIPAPAVGSSVVTIHRRAGPDDRGSCYRDVAVVVDAAFGQRRKMLRQSLARLCGSSGAAALVLELAGVDPTRRAEELSLVEFTAIALARTRGVG